MKICQFNFNFELTFNGLICRENLNAHYSVKRLWEQWTQHTVRGAFRPTILPIENLQGNCVPGCVWENPTTAGHYSVLWGIFWVNRVSVSFLQQLDLKKNNIGTIIPIRNLELFNFQLLPVPYSNMDDWSKYFRQSKNALNHAAVYWCLPLIFPIHITPHYTKKILPPPQKKIYSVQNIFSPLCSSETERYSENAHNINFVSFMAKIFLGPQPKIFKKRRKMENLRSIALVLWFLSHNFLFDGHFPLFLLRQL